MARSVLSRCLPLVLALAGGASPACVETGEEVCANGFVCPLGDRCVDIGRDTPLCVLGLDTRCVFEVSDGRELSIPCEAGRVCDTGLADCVSVAQYEACTGKDDLAPCQVAGYGPGSLQCRREVCTALTCGDGFVDAEAGEACDPRFSSTCNLFCRAPTPVRLDLLLVIDQSSGMSQAQETLAGALEPFMIALVDASDLNVDVHVAVTTTDASSPCSGTVCTKDPDSGEPSVGGFYRDAPPRYCGATRAPNGRCRGHGCTASASNCQDARATLTEDPSTGCPRCRSIARETWIADAQHPVRWGQVGTPYSGSIQALVTAVTPATAPGFRRAGALLAIVVLTDKDDCSVSSPDFYLLESLPETSYRCFAAGMSCTSTPGPDGDTTYRDCVPVTGYLHSPGPLAEAFDAAVLEDATPLALHLQVLAGVPTEDATVHVSADRRITPACSAATSAEPALRLQSFLEQVRWLQGLGEEQVRLDTFCGSSALDQYAGYRAAFDRILEQVRAASAR
jgi:hypothetical protein